MNKEDIRREKEGRIRELKIKVKVGREEGKVGDKRLIVDR